MASYRQDLQQRSPQQPTYGDATDFNQSPEDAAAVLVTSTNNNEDSHTRSLVKGITWRVVATTTTVIIAWIVIGEVGTALSIGFFEAFAKIGIYYFHERLWAKIPL